MTLIELMNQHSVYCIHVVEVSIANRSLGDSSKRKTLLVGSRASLTCKIIENTKKMVQFYTNFHYTCGCKLLFVYIHVAPLPRKCWEGGLFGGGGAYIGWKTLSGQATPPSPLPTSMLLLIQRALFRLHVEL